MDMTTRLAGRVVLVTAVPRDRRRGSRPGGGGGRRRRPDRHHRGRRRAPPRRDRRGGCRSAGGRDRGRTRTARRGRQLCGRRRGGPIHLVPAESWDHVVNVNLRGTFLVCKHAVTQMLTQEPRDGERGSIVNIASIEGIEGTAGGSSYNASKGGVVLLTKNMAIDYGRQGIRTNAVCPGFIDTPMFQDVLSTPSMKEVRDHIEDEHKLRRFGRPDEIAAVIAFLLSSGRVVRHRSGDRRRRWLHRRPRPRPHVADGAVTPASSALGGLDRLDQFAHRAVRETGDRTVGVAYDAPARRSRTRCGAGNRSARGCRRGPPPSSRCRPAAGS